MTPMAQMSLQKAVSGDTQNSQANIHWFSMTCFPKDFRGHIPRGSTSCCQDVELLFIHNSRQSKIRDEEIRIILRCSEQQILRLQVAMHNAVVVEVSDGRKGSSNEISGIRFVVVAFTADAIEQLASKRKVGNKVNCEHNQICASVPRNDNIRLFMVSK
jgi:hypothetical protein